MSARALGTLCVLAALAALLTSRAAAQDPPAPAPPAPAPPAPEAPPPGPPAMDPVVTDTKAGIAFRLPTGATSAPGQGDVRIWKYSPPGMPEGEITLYPGPEDGDMGTWRRTVRAALAPQGWTVAADLPDADHANGRVGITRYVNKGHPTVLEQVYFIQRGKCFALWFTFGSGTTMPAWRFVITAVADAFRLNAPGDRRLAPPPGGAETTTANFVLRAAPGIPASLVAEIGADCEGALAEAIALTDLPAPPRRYVVHVLADPAAIAPFAGSEPTTAVWAPAGPALLVLAAKSPGTAGDRARAVCAQHVHASAGCHTLPGWLAPGLGEWFRSAKRQKGTLAFDRKGYPLLAAARTGAKGGVWKPMEVFFRRPVEEFNPADPAAWSQAFAVAAWLRAAPDERLKGFVKRFLDGYRAPLDPSAARGEALGELELGDAEKQFDEWAKKTLK